MSYRYLKKHYWVGGLCLLAMGLGSSSGVRGLFHQDARTGASGLKPSLEVGNHAMLAQLASQRAGGEPSERMGWELKQLVSTYKNLKQRGLQKPLSEIAPSLPVDASRLPVEIFFETEAAASTFLKSTLAKRNQFQARARFVTGTVDIEDLDALAQESGLQWIRPAYFAKSVGVVTSQGNEALLADLARSTAPGYRGDGITVGVLSDSFDISTSASTDAADDLANGDLPGPLSFLAEHAGTGTDEGRAMLQIIADLAPGAGLAFHTANGGQVAFANAIARLRAEGSDVLVDDLLYLAEPMFQDGLIAQAVDTTVADGALYFSAAGNNGNLSWESSYHVSNQWIGLRGGPLVDFDEGPEEDVFLGIDVPVGRQISVVLQWSEPYASVPDSPGSASAFDLYLTGTDDSLTQVLTGSLAPNIGLDPVEIITFENDGDLDLDGNPGADTRFHLVIEHVSGPPPALLKIVVFTPGNTVFADRSIRAATLYGHANAASALAIGAAGFNRTPFAGVSPPQAQTYSALGGVSIFYDKSGSLLPSPLLRQKPEFVATDGVNTSFFGTDTSIDPDAFPNFFGTSAAAPHAAAIAALLLEKTGGPGTLDLASLKALLQAGALDINPVGLDFKTGYGLIQAKASLDLAPLGFPAWRRLYLPSVETLTLATDTDGDSLVDLLEYHLGTLPNNPNPPPYTQSKEGDALILELSSAAYLARPVNVVEQSADLIEWKPLDYTAFTLGEDGENHRLRYRLEPEEGETEAFLRIQPVEPAGF